MHRFIKLGGANSNTDSSGDNVAGTNPNSSLYEEAFNDTLGEPGLPLISGECYRVGEVADIDPTTHIAHSALVNYIGCLNDGDDVYATLPLICKVVTLASKLPRIKGIRVSQGKSKAVVWHLDSKNWVFNKKYITDRIWTGANASVTVGVSSCIYEYYICIYIYMDTLFLFCRDNRVLEDHHNALPLGQSKT